MAETNEFEGFDIPADTPTDNKEKIVVEKEIETPADEKIEDEDKKKETEIIQEEEKEEGQEEITGDYDYNSIVEWQKERGILPDDFELPEDFDNTDDAYSEIMEKHEKKKQDEILKPLTDWDVKNGGKLTYLIEHGNLDGFDAITDYSTWNADELNDTQSVKLLTEQYKALGLSDNVINKKIDKLKDIEELVDEAKLILPSAQKKSIKQKEEKQSQLKQQEQEKVNKQKQFEDDYAKNVDGIDEFLGIKIRKQLKDKVKTGLGTTHQKINENYSKYAATLTLLDQLGILDGKTDALDKIYNTKAVRKVKEKYNPNPFDKKKTKIKQTSSTTEDLNTFINSLEQ